jgi:hypothetical protein
LPSFPRLFLARSVIWISKRWCLSFPLVESSRFQTTWPALAFISVAVNPLKAGFKWGGMLSCISISCLYSGSCISRQLPLVERRRCSCCCYTFISCFDLEQVDSSAISCLPE